MRIGRLLRLLLLALPLALGVAAGAEHPPIPTGDSAPTIGTPRESLPTPVHNEATCAFCQAAIFPPCTPAAVRVPEAALGMVREDLVSPDARLPHADARRLADSRAPPTLRVA